MYFFKRNIKKCKVCKKHQKSFTFEHKNIIIVVSSGKKWGKVGDFYMLMGEYHYSIDDKGRLTMPSKLRIELKETCIITRGLDKCLFIYSEEEWANLIQKYRELPNTKDARNFMRFFLSGANACEFDKQGRIKITSPLIEYANLEKDCVIIQAYLEQLSY